MKKDLDIARRIRGDANNDHRDLMEKTGKENFVSLPYRNVPQGMADLKKHFRF